MIPVLQCGRCKFSGTFKWLIEEDGPGIGKVVCSEYPDGIPNYVEEATGECPRKEVGNGA